MNLLTRSLATATAVTLAAMTFGCAAPGAEAGAPNVDDAELEATNGTIWSGSWQGTAYTPVLASSGNFLDPIYGSAYFLGPRGQTTKAGVCLLQKTSTPCETVNDCSGVSIPTGGYRYCTKGMNEYSKSCYIRPGTQAMYCAGTPVTGQPVGTGYLQTPTQPANGSVWVSYACFAGCLATDPAVSSASFQPEGGSCNLQAGCYWTNGNCVCP